MGVLYEYFSNVQRNQLRMQTNLASQGVANEGIGYFNDLDIENYRITLIDSDGVVLYDSRSDNTKMENHLEHEEIKQALSEGFGESARYSVTLMERYLYCAKRLPDGTVLRLSIAQNTILTLIFGMLQPICIIIVVAIVLSLVLASRLSKKIVKPLNELNLDEPLSNDGYDELSPLLRRIDAQQRQIELKSRELHQKQVEFETVTTNMKEGIVLLNNKGTVLSINRAASKLFGADKNSVGQDILSVNHSLELQQLLQKSRDGKYAEMVMELGDGKYQLDINPVISNGQVSGMVLLLFDASEKIKSEQMRREFTANVSHELKTPLHTISGYSELMANGMVKQEDMTKFSRQIYTEAQRMIRLVEDIIKLSHLDEGADDMQREEIDLYALAKNTMNMLKPEADAAKVTLSLTGKPVKLFGIPQLLDGIIFNLCDNAIKYNRENGSVNVEIEPLDDAVVLSVSDTGIGIPKEHQERIFERFYRVDKSHSKEVGGTGLGLSIVKHAAKLHDATIEVHSVLDRGTTIIIKFSRTK